MPGKAVPVSGDVLAWAIQDAGFDERGVAHSLDVSTATVRAWVEEESQPLTGQFRQLAKLLNRAPSFFLQSEPPEAGTPARFRRHTTSGEREPLHTEELRALRTAQRLQAVVSWLRRNRDDAEFVDLPRSTQDRSPDRASGELRRYLRWHSTDQREAPTASRVFSLLRERVEGVGVLVMLLPLRRQGCRGFALDDEHAPLVAVNSAQTVEARIYTLMHEIGHVVLAEDSFDEGYAPDTRRERWCERFAASFLLPKLPVERYVEGSLGGAATSLSDARKLAARFRVSLTAACIRLEELGLAPDEGLAHLIPTHDNLKPEDERGFNPDPSTAGRRLREFGPAVVSEVLLAEEAGRLRRHDVQRYLRVTDQKYDDLAGRVREAVTGNLAVFDEDD